MLCAACFSANRAQKSMEGDQRGSPSKGCIAEFTYIKKTKQQHKKTPKPKKLNHGYGAQVMQPGRPLAPLLKGGPQFL